MDGGQGSRRRVTEDTITNHQQERQRCSDVGGGCSNSESGDKGEGVVAAALAMAATKMTVIAAERARTAAMATLNALTHVDHRPRVWAEL